MTRVACNHIHGNSYHVNLEKHYSRICKIISIGHSLYDTTRQSTLYGWIPESPVVASSK
jgi:hypothetical protein